MFAQNIDKNLFDHNQKWFHNLRLNWKLVEQ